MAAPRKLTDSQVAELAVWAHGYNRRRWPLPLKTQAARLGVSRSTLNRYAQGIRNASAS
jgi:transcriptional regulator with XRE-family HTH domain